MNILLVSITGAAIFAFFRISGVLLKRYGSRYGLLKRFGRAYPIIEFIAWTIFVFWTFGVLFSDRVYYPYIVTGMALVAMGLVSWFYLRDVVAGMVFRSQNDLAAGDNIQVGRIAGQVKSIRLTYLEVATHDGSTVKVPNSRLGQELISGSATPEGLEEFKISLSVNRQLSGPEIEEKIRKEVLNSPWCDYKIAPVIKLKEESASSYYFDVIVYTMNQKHHRIMEKALKNRFEKGTG